MKRVECGRHHRMVEIIPGLTLCECASSGPGASTIAVDTARLMVQRQGGFQALRDRVELEEKRKVEERRLERGKYARPA